MEFLIGFFLGIIISVLFITVICATIISEKKEIERRKHEKKNC